MKRMLLVLLCLTCVWGTVSCAVLGGKTPPQDPEVSYAPVIEAYTALVRVKTDGGELTAPAEGASAVDTALFEIVGNSEDPTTLGYAIKDINRDGIFELVLMTSAQQVYALFTLEKNKPTLLTATKVSMAISPDGTVTSTEYIPDRLSCIRIQTLRDGRLEGLEYGSSADYEGKYYKIEDGVRSEITFEEKQTLDHLHGTVVRDIYYINKTTGFRFVPAIPADSSENPPPVADLSSYEGILATYKTIVEQFADCTKKAWVAGAYEDLFTFTSNEDYDIFHSLFYHGFTHMPTTTYFGSDYPHNGNDAYGYARKDLNKDGVEELIIMDQNYTVLDIFTMKDGRPVLLQGVSGCWIDENGRLHMHVGTGGLVARDAEAYLYEIRDGELHCVASVGYRVNMYLDKEGWYTVEDGVHKSISAEEGEKLYEQCTQRPPVCVEREYTRMMAGLTFVPLFEKTLALRMHKDTYTNSAYSEATKLTVSEVTEGAEGAVTFAFDCLKPMDGEFDPEVKFEEIRTRIEGEATLTDDRYVFDVDGVKGYLEFTVTAVWVVITESENENVSCRAYLLNVHEKKHP